MIELYVKLIIFLVCSSHTSESLLPSHYQIDYCLE